MASLVGAQFERRGGEGVVITPDSRTNSILVNAPSQIYPQIAALISRLDAPDDTTESVIRTYNLEVADASEATRILQETLRLDEDGRTTGISIEMEGAEAGSSPIEVQATIVADRRSNSIVVTATKASLPVIESILAKLEEAPARSPIEYRIITLEHAPAVDVSYTLDRLLMARGFEWQDVAVDYNRFENQLIVGATPDQFKVIDSVLAELDTPGTRTRRTDFVALQFADATKLKEALANFYGPYAMEADTPGKQNVRIIADEATNSLVVTAAEPEWKGILALVDQLDSEEYDASLQLAVLPLVYADARSVSRAINDAFRPQVEAARRNQNGNRNGNKQPEGDRPSREREETAPPVLMQSEEWVSASAEVQTNSLVISANRQNLAKIQRIVEQLDVADFVRLPAPRLIPVGTGDPESLARALRTIYLPEGENRGGTLRIVGDRPANAVIVRADEEEFAQIQALANALQQEADSKGLSVRVLRLESAPAARVAESVRGAFAAKAKQAQVPFSVQVDPVGNALVVASTAPFYEEVAATVREMDRLAPAAGQGIFLIDLENVPASVAERAVQQIGLDKPQPADSTSRLVVEPIKISTLSGRNAVLVVANPADKETILGILKAIDSAPGAELGTSELRVVALQRANAVAVMNLIDKVIDPAGGPDGNAIAAAVKEQIRRLNIMSGRGEPVSLDLTKPIRVTADEAGNSILISSTPDNVKALVEVVALFDRPSEHRSAHRSDLPA